MLVKEIIAAIAVLAAAACAPPASAPESEQAAQTQPAGPIAATGQVTAVNAAQATIGIAHEPIPALNWPSMTMQFAVENPAQLEGIAVGDRVAFELKSATDSTIVTGVRKQ